MPGSDNIYRPSASPDLDWPARNTPVRQSAGVRQDIRNKDAERNCEKKLGHSPEKETQNMSPNATNISHG